MVSIKIPEEPDMPEQDLPEVVWDGEFEDHEWRAIASKKDPDRTRAERIRLAQPPRRHPFQAGEVHVEEVTLSDGQVRTRYFPSRQDAKAFKAKHETGDKKLRAKAVTGASDEPLEPQEAALATQTAQDLAPRPDEAPIASEAPEQARLDKASADGYVGRQRGAQAT
jgi:hypothetical protein